MEGRFKREGTYIYLWLTHTVVWQKQIQQCKTIIQLKTKKIALATLAIALKYHHLLMLHSVKSVIRVLSRVPCGVRRP